MHGLGDSRTERRTGEVRTPAGAVVRIFCISCHRPGGYVTADAPAVLYLCDPCTTTWGGLPLPAVTPEDAARYTRKG